MTPWLLFALFALASCAAPQVSSDASRELAATSQAILDAVTAGDRTFFERTLDPEGLFTDEEGNTRTGKELILEIRGLPPGYVGTLRAVDPKVRITGDVGVVTYAVAETLELHGQRLETRFHTTDVYRRTDRGWLLIAAQTMVLPSELRPIAIDPARFDDYTGTYRLGTEITARVFREGDQLIMQRSDRDPERLLPIGGDRFVRRGAPRGERFFRRDAAGRVIELVDRRDNNDLVWRRE